MTSDPSFAAAATHFHADNSGSDESEDDGDWSTGSAILDEEGEVDDETFLSHFSVKDGVSPGAIVDSVPIVRTLASSKNQDIDAGSSTSSSIVEGAPAIAGPARPKKQYTISEAWSRQACINATRKSKARSVTEYRFIYSRFHCTSCCDYGSTIVPIGDDAYFKDCLRDKWFDTEFISGFCSLIAHDAHDVTLPPPFMTAKNRVKMVLCPYPKAEVRAENVKTFSNMITHFVLIALSASHFAVLDFDIHLSTVTVFDGLNYKIDAWQHHVVHTLKEYGLVDVRDVPRFVYSAQAVRSEKRQTLNITFGNGARRIMSNTLFVQQRDTHNCGPIACLKVMEMFGYLR